MDLMAIEQYAVRVAADLTGQPAAVFEGVLDGEPTALSHSTTEFDPEDLITVIMAIINAVLENCPQKEGYLNNVKADPRLVWKVWFRYRFVRKINDTGIDNKLLASAMIGQVGPASELEQIWNDVKEPDFSVA
jgi:hypothetical protein